MFDFNMKNTFFRIILIFVFAFSASGADKQMEIMNHPRYIENPIYIFFESYIQDVIGYLPPEKSDSIQKINIQKVFKTKNFEWKAVIKETLHLSDTIEISILDLWYLNREHFKDEDGNYDPIWFSQIFTDEYMKDDSQVDVWPDGALEAAKNRIKQGQREDKQKVEQRH